MSKQVPIAQGASNQIYKDPHSRSGISGKDGAAVVNVVNPPEKQVKGAPQAPALDFPNIDRTFQLFTTGPTKLPIVETVTYSTTVPWLKGRPAWLADYATYFATSRHFIARSLNGTPDYFTQKVTPGSSFNVFRKDKKIQFYLLVDLTRCKMGFYYVDLDTKERLLLKTYSVGVGRNDMKSRSGSLTAMGVYSLGSKIAIYSPGTTGLSRDQKVEMITLFGTRWIPFHEAIEGNIALTQGYGIHGAPWVYPTPSSAPVENRSTIGKQESDGSIVLAHEDMEELFSIVITKPTFVVIVKDFNEARLPGIEVATPSRLN
ncbi:MAG: L,D-transpeptidase [Chlamydiales bacterium]